MVMVFELLRWWYGAGWLQAARSIQEWTGSVRQAFSMPILVKTLFAPWRRIVSLKGRSLDAKLRASLDNLVSRTVGFITRFMVLIASFLLLCLMFIAGLIVTIVWPFLPVVIVYCIIRGITG